MSPLLRLHDSGDLTDGWGFLRYLYPIEIPCRFYFTVSASKLLEGSRIG
jgi:hypothetical protein